MLAASAAAERTFDELYVRSETGLGAEVGPGALTGQSNGVLRTPAAAAAPARGRWDRRPRGSRWPTGVGGVIS